MLEKLKNKLKNKLKSNTEYYKRNFQALENGKRAEFNWAAFILGIMWLAYRKMYLWFFLLPVFFILLLTPLVFIFIESLPSDLLTVICIAVGLAINIAFGFFANAIYYRAVKSKIKKGYHKLEEFSPTAFILSLMLVLWSGFFIIQTFIITLFAIADHYANPFRKNKKKETFEINADSINQYLEHSKEHRYGRILSNIICGLTIVLFVIGTIIGEQKQTILDNSATKIEQKDNSNKKNNAINSNSAQTGNIAPSAKKHVNSSKRNNANNTDINAQMNDIAT